MPGNQCVGSSVFRGGDGVVGARATTRVQSLSEGADNMSRVIYLLCASSHECTAFTMTSSSRFREIGAEVAMVRTQKFGRGNATAARKSPASAAAESAFKTTMRMPDSIADT